ncbi:MAG: cupin domain-containing protein [Bacteroidaceae bacterium]
MNTPTIKQTTDNYCVATVGNLNTFAGKTFLKEAMNISSAEISFGSLDNGEATPFSHHHKQNEEIYIFLKGDGTITLDDTDINITEGSIVRVSPSVSRKIKCNNRLVYICIQAKQGSLTQYTMTDGVIES